jgi:hypothetical protein
VLALKVSGGARRFSLHVRRERKTMEYSLDFSERLIEAAKSFVGKDNVEDETARLVLYLSLLSCEISIKALLEKAGFTPKELKKRSHDFTGLTTDLCFCDIPCVIGSMSLDKSAADILGKVVDPAFGNATVGTPLSAEELGASRYSNEIRYGDQLTHYPPLMMLNCAEIVCQWAKENITHIKKSARLQGRCADGVKLFRNSGDSLSNLKTKNA